MASDGAGGGGVWASVVSLVASPTSRTAVVAVCASALAVVLLQVSPLTSRKPPKVPDKDTYREQDQNRNRSTRSVSSSSLSLSESKNSVAIFWDVDNCSPPTGSSGHSVAQSIRRAAQAAAKYISNSDRNVSIVSFKAYLELTTEGSQPTASRVQLHSELQGSGVSLIDTPKSGRKDVADKMMITDLLSFAIDKRPPALIVLLSGDRDFAYPLGILRNRGYEILLVVPPIGATPILEASANHVMRWRQDVLGLERDAHGRLYDKPAAKEIDMVRGRAMPAKEIDNGKSSSKGTPSKGALQNTTNVSALKGPGAPPVPSIFHPLVRALEQMRKEGQSRPLRSQCATRLLAQDVNVYKKAGATNWGDYAAVAEAANIVTLGEGSKPGMEWIALRSIYEDNLSILKGSEKTTSPPASQNTNSQNDIAIFHPLIEVYKSVKAGLPKTEYPTVTQMTAQLTRMWEVGLRDAYAQAGVNNFTAYMELAEEANVGRLAKSETKPSTTIVQIHPKYANLHTDIITPSSNEARMIDTSKTTAPSATSSGSTGLASVLGLTKKNREKEVNKETKESKEVKEKNKENEKDLTHENKEVRDNGKSVNTDSTVPSTPQKGNEKSTLYHAHQPSGERIHVSYFPLCNLLLTQRAEGKTSSSDAFVQSVLVKHPKIAHFVTTSEQFTSYLSRAERDEIITTEGKVGKRLIRLHPRLCAGEEEHNKRRAAAGVTSGMKRSDSAGPTFTILQKEKKEILGNTETASEESQEVKVSSFGTEPATPQERVKFKPLVDALVSLRRESAELNTTPQLSKVSSTLVANHSVEGKVVSPGTWIQTQGYSSFVEYYQAAERKGFIHLLKSEIDAKDRIRLAKKYEAMFFHSDD